MVFDKICQRHATVDWFSPGTPVSSTNKTDRHDITEILVNLAVRFAKQHTTTHIVKLLNVYT
jgi:hypothetical protein